MVCRRSYIGYGSFSYLVIYRDRKVVFCGESSLYFCLKFCFVLFKRVRKNFVFAKKKVVRKKLSGYGEGRSGIWSFNKT